MFIAALREYIARLSRIPRKTILRMRGHVMPGRERIKAEPEGTKHYNFLPVSFPIEMTCPVCGHEVDLWSYEDETKCFVCGYKIFKNESIVH
jgi:hypothetical protein